MNEGDGFQRVHNHAVESYERRIVAAETEFSPIRKASRGEGFHCISIDQAIERIPRHSLAAYESIPAQGMHSLNQANRSAVSTFAREVVV